MMVPCPWWCVRGVDECAVDGVRRCALQHGSAYLMKVCCAQNSTAHISVP